MNEAKGTVTNVIVAGVGGQGSILTSHLLAEAALQDGYDVKLAETFGAATRGGAVLAHVRIGQVWSPMIVEDEADAVVALEPLECLRVAWTFLKPGGWVLLNTHPWYPVDVSVGRAEYPSQPDIECALEQLGGRVLSLDATSLAQQAGDARASNCVILGGLFALGIAPVSEVSLVNAMEKRWIGRERVLAVNRAAFDLGRQEIYKRLGGHPC
jgi:indolepyruvate ferredoxin oxidoreductase beta subunit